MLLLLQCKEEEKAEVTTDSKIVLDIEQKTVTLPATQGENIAIDIRASAEWFFTESIQWLSLTKADAQTLKVSYEANTKDSPRSGKILITAKELTEEVTVIQQAPVLLRIQPSQQIDLDYSSGDTTLSILLTEGYDWTAEETPAVDWITALTPSQDHRSLTLTYQQNPGTTLSRTATVRVSVSDYPTIFEDIQLTQQPQSKPLLTFEHSTLSINEGSGSPQTVKVKLSEAVSSDFSFRIRIVHTSTASYDTDYTLSESISSDVFTLSIPATETEVSFDLTPIDDILKESNENIRLTIALLAGEENISIGTQSQLDITIVDNTDDFWVIYEVKTHETTGTSGVKVFALDGEGYGETWDSDTHGNRVLGTFTHHTTMSHTIIRIDAFGTKFSDTYDVHSNTINGVGYAYANENTTTTAIFAVSTITISSYRAHPDLYTTDSHPLHKPAIEDAEYIAKGHVLMIVSLANPRTELQEDGSYSPLYSDDFHDITISGALNEVIAMTNKG